MKCSLNSKGGVATWDFEEWFPAVLKVAGGWQLTLGENTILVTRVTKRFITAPLRFNLHSMIYRHGETVITLNLPLLAPPLSFFNRNSHTVLTLTCALPRQREWARVCVCVQRKGGGKLQVLRLITTSLTIRTVARGPELLVSGLGKSVTPRGPFLDLLLW